MSEIEGRYRSKSPPQALAHLIEELGEATAAAGKTLRWGPDSYNPELPPEQRELNIDWVMREIADVERAIAAFRHQLSITPYHEWRPTLVGEIEAA